MRNIANRFTVDNLEQYDFNFGEQLKKISALEQIFTDLRKLK